MGELISGIELFRRIIDNPQPLHDKLWDMAVSETRPNTPEGRAALKMRLLEIASTIRHHEVRMQYRQHFLERFNATFYAPGPRPVVKETAPVVDMRSFVARRDYGSDEAAMLAELRKVEEALEQANAAAQTDLNEDSFAWQQELLRRRASVMKRIADASG